MAIDWDKQVGKSVLEEGGNKEAYVGTGMPYSVVPMGSESPIPELLGLGGGLLGAYVTKSPAGAAAGRTGLMALGRSLVPSLVGSTAGTATGLGIEAALMGEMTPGRATSALLENAAWDVGGNLAFTIAGKTYRLGKSALESLGITKAGTFDDATMAAQKFLSQRDATLTRGQLTASPLDKFLEEVSRGGTGMNVFEQQQKKVGEAVSKGVQEVKTSLQTSEAFQQALKADEPLSRAAGENFQNLINTSRTAFKDKYRPFYESLSKDYNVYVDMRPVKQAAQAELDRIARLKDIPANAERKSVLEQIIKQDNAIEFGAAHDLISSFKGAAQDAKIPGAGTTSKGAAYSKYASEVEKQMDSVIDLSRKQLGGDLVQRYKETQTAYRQGMEGLFNETINEGMKMSPSKVGAYIFDLADTGKSTDLFKAVSQVDKYATTAGKESAQVLNDFKYGFLEQAMSTPDKVKAFAGKLDSDPEMKRAFFKLFKNEAQPLKDVLNAADIGLEGGKSGIAAYLRNKAAITGGQVAAGSLGYLVLPEDVKSKLADNLPETAITAGAFIITPRLLAKAATNREAITALADLAKVQNNPKFAGAAAAKLVDRLNKSGIIDSEYITEVDNLFNRMGNTQEQGTVPTETAPTKINWDEVTQ